MTFGYLCDHATHICVFMRYDARVRELRCKDLNSTTHVMGSLNSPAETRHHSNTAASSPHQLIALSPSSSVPIQGRAQHLQIVWCRFRGLRALRSLVCPAGTRHYCCCGQNVIPTDCVVVPRLPWLNDPGKPFDNRAAV